jgi:hypothetical protein
LWARRATLGALERGGATFSTPSPGGAWTRTACSTYDRNASYLPLLTSSATVVDSTTGIASRQFNSLFALEAASGRRQVAIDAGCLFRIFRI